MSEHTKIDLKEIQNILDKDNALSIFQDLLGEAPKNNRVVRLFDDTKNASEVFREAKGKYPAHIHNYSTGEHYTATNAYLKAYGLEWKQAVIELGKQYGHLLHDYDNTRHEKRTYTPKPQPTEQERREASRLANPTFGEWSTEHLAYWAKFGVELPMLNGYGVKPLQSFDLMRIETGEHKCTVTPQELVFAYTLTGEEVVKKYQPHSEKYKWQWIGNKPQGNIIWGLSQTPNRCKKIVIVEGLKDAIALNQLFAQTYGVYAVGLDSASNDISANDLATLKSKVENETDLFLCLDNDKTGKEQNEKKAQKYGLSYLPYLPTFEGAKDIADLCANFDKYDMYDVIDWILRGQRITPTQEPKEQANNESKRLTPSQKAQKKAYNIIKPYNFDDRGNLNIDLVRLIDILKKLGFRRYDLGKKDEFTFIHIQDNVVKEVGITYIKDCFFEWLDTNHINEAGASLPTLKNKLYRGINSFFSENLLSQLNIDASIKFVKDAKDKAFFYFRNGIVEVTEKSINLVPYSQMKGHIWENQILERDFLVLPEETAKKGVFAQFCDLIAKEDYMNFECLQSIIGYLLHDFKDNKRKAVNFTDSSLERGNNGRTGKTLLAKALGLLRVHGEINGKNFVADNKHKYQDLNLDTQLVNLNDVKKGFKLEWIYNDITEGLMVEKKNQNPFRIKPNIIVCSNLPLELEGGSDKDRIVEFEFSNKFSIQYTPQDHFKHWFFRDWSVQEWSAFDNFMLCCVKFYLEVGNMIQPENTNLAKRKLMSFTAPEFVEFIEAQELKTGVEYEKKALLQEFAQAYTDFESVKMKTFTKWLRHYVESNPAIKAMEERQNKTTRQSIFVLKSAIPSEIVK